MKSVLRTLAVAGLLFPLPILAADKLAEGTVKKIDAPTQRIMLAHGRIDSIGMMPMTMMFKVKEAAMLKTVKEGDKVRFQVEDLGGNYTVTHLEVAK